MNMTIEELALARQGEDDAIRARLAGLPDPEKSALALIERGRAALDHARTLAQARSVLAQTKVLEAAARAVELTRETISEAAALRVVAERRVGELMREMPKNPGTRTLGGGAGAGGPVADPPADRPTLADFGIGKGEADRYRRLAAIPEERFAAAVEEAKAEAAARAGGVTAAAVLRRAHPEREMRPDERWLEVDRFLGRCGRLADEAEAVLAVVRFGRDPGESDAVVYGAALHRLGRLRDAVAAIHAELEGGGR